jgi:hypothetical protein
MMKLNPEHPVWQGKSAEEWYPPENITVFFTLKIKTKCFYVSALLPTDAVGQRYGAVQIDADWLFPLGSGKLHC